MTKHTERKLEYIIVIIGFILMIVGSTLMTLVALLSFISNWNENELVLKILGCIGLPIIPFFIGYIVYDLIKFIKLYNPKLFEEYDKSMEEK